MTDLIHAYENGATLLRDAVTGMTDEQMRARPVPGKWSTLEVIAHLADFEIINTERIQRTLAEDRPTLFDADPDRFTAGGGYDRRDPETELRTIEALRRHLTSVLRNLSPDQWERKGVHSSDGPLSVRQFVERTTRHIAHHLPFIAEKRLAM